MKVLDKYIASSVVVGFAMASFVMLSIFSFVDYTSQLSVVGKGDYGALQAAFYVLLSLPQRFYELSPSILLLGGILALGTMASNSELIVMRASGISPFRITISVLQIGLVIAIMVAVIGEFLVPVTSRNAKDYRVQSLNKKILISGAENIWARDGDKYINIKKIYPNYLLKEVRIFEFDKNKRLNKVTHAGDAHYKNNEWILKNIKISVITQMSVTRQFVKQIKLKHLLLLELFTVLELKPKDMSANELLTYVQYLKNNKLETKQYLLAFWIKIFTPFTCLAMLFLAMPIVLSTTPRSGGTGQRVIFAILLGVGFYVLNNTINHLGLAININPFLSAIIPLLLVTLVSAYFMKRVN